MIDYSSLNLSGIFKLVLSKHLQLTKILNTNEYVKAEIKVNRLCVIERVINNLFNAIWSQYACKTSFLGFYLRLSLLWPMLISLRINSAT